MSFSGYAHPLLRATSPTTLSIAVGSTNRCKIAAVTAAFRTILSVTDPTSFITLSVAGFDAPSQVSAQPFSDDETRSGAINRAKNAASLHASATGAQPSFSVGLEGGVVDGDDFSSQIDDPSSTPSPSCPIMWCCAYMVVFCPSESTPQRRFGVGKTGSFPLPPLMAALVRSGIELGDADDFVTNRVDSKRGVGTVGVLTSEIITREKYYEHALILAMTKFIQREVFYSRVPDDKDDTNKEELESIVATLKAGRK